MNDLSVCLTQCKAGCHLNETVTNHVMYADDICLMVRNCSTENAEPAKMHMYDMVKIDPKVFEISPPPPPNGSLAD